MDIGGICDHKHYAWSEQFNGRGWVGGDSCRDNVPGLERENLSHFQRT